MLLSGILDMIKLLLTLIFGCIPTVPVLPAWIVSFIKLCELPFRLIGADILVIVFYDITFWTLALQGWAIVEWCYRKIPGLK